MDQIAIGRFLSQKRKEKNITQEQLASKLNVSNKTISKWETGKCMPDYQSVKPLCQELDITVSELLEGKAADELLISLDENQMLNMLNRIQTLENQKNLLLGIVLIAISILCFMLSGTIHGSSVRNFFSGVLLGLSVGESLIGVYIVVSSLCKKGQL